MHFRGIYNFVLKFRFPSWAMRYCLNPLGIGISNDDPNYSIGSRQPAPGVHASAAAPSTSFS